MPKSADKGPKKSYSSPQLSVYGTVRDLTKNIGTHGNSDPGHHSIGHIRTHT
jgi:hypothetical protein